MNVLQERHSKYEEDVLSLLVIFYNFGYFFPNLVFLFFFFFLTFFSNLFGFFTILATFSLIWYFWYFFWHSGYFVSTFTITFWLFYQLFVYWLKELTWNSKNLGMFCRRDTASTKKMYCQAEGRCRSGKQMALYLKEEKIDMRD